LLDLFCGAGGAAVGYHRAGFEVVGVDHRPQPHYPFEFHQDDALSYPLKGFDVIHASPPCQAHTALRSMPTAKVHADLLPATRARLQKWGGMYVIENVVGAPMTNPLMLCGSMFGLGAGGRYLRRHRLFDCPLLLFQPTECRHHGEAIGVYGHGSPTGHGYTGFTAECRVAMGIDWTNRDELCQAIPPAYTEWIGLQLQNALQRRVA
jgi:DNA (cytosine-5)-methyltransferase 1